MRTFNQFLEAQNPNKPANLQAGPGNDVDSSKGSPMSPRGLGSGLPRGTKLPGGPGSKNADAPVPKPQPGLSGAGLPLKGPLPPGLSGGWNKSQPFDPSLSAGVPALSTMQRKGK